ncbi:uncharacterized protein LOC119179735 isoform X2 [Rhipicephalus microplus]|uniref:uncharacterized protein LOC119179735 isoform X2 n=1 Tax=Rhipicephalus microplus TaxID=6941 RepID=UPI003F6C6BFA
MASSEPSGRPHIKEKSERRYRSVKDCCRKGASGLTPGGKSRPHSKGPQFPEYTELCLHSL